MIGHDSTTGAHDAIAGQAATAGAVRIARKAGIGAGVHSANGVTVTALTMVTRSSKEAGARYSSGWPAEPSLTWWRRVVQFRRPR